MEEQSLQGEPRSSVGSEVTDLSLYSVDHSATGERREFESDTISYIHKRLSILMNFSHDEQQAKYGSLMSDTEGSISPST